MSSVDIGVGESVRVTKTQIHVGLRGKMENGINVVSLEAVHDLGGICNVAIVEGEIPLVVQDTGVVQGSAVIELIEGDDVVRVGVGQGKMSYEPACTAMKELLEAAVYKTETETETRRDDVGVGVVGVSAYMNPAPPVIMIFLTFGKGSNFVVPVRTGASFQTPKSSKNLFAPLLEAAGAAQTGVSNSNDCL